MVDSQLNAHTMHPVSARDSAHLVRYRWQKSLISYLARRYRREILPLLLSTNSKGGVLAVCVLGWLVLKHITLKPNLPSGSLESIASGILHASSLQSMMPQTTKSPNPVSPSFLFLAIS
jgi:hypothetical protein